jgi:lipopolysaccharide transport system ATP-binding protein
VDEVLAVGDAAFQRKCLGKMSDVAREGRTVLFISHNMGSIANLCARVLWVENGAIRFTGNAATVISEYLSSGAVTSSMWTNPSSSPDGDLHIESVRILSEDNQPSATLSFDKHFRIEITYVLTDSLRELAVVYQIKDVSGSVVWGSWDTDNIGMKYLVRKPGRYKSICTIPGGLLKPGRYLLSVASHANHKRLACHDDVLTFNVSEVGYRFNRNRAGLITPILEWEVSRTDERRIVAK